MKKHFRHSVTYFFLRPLIGFYLLLRFNFRAKPFKEAKDVKGPYLIISNHVLAWDPFLMAQSFKVPIYYVASDMIFSIPFWSKVIKYLVSPIPKTKYRSDMDTVRDMIKMVKQGGTIGLFPEGNATFKGSIMSIEPSIAKLAKLLKIPVLLYNIEGAYLTKPRWSKTIRRAKVSGSVKEIIMPDEIKSLSSEALYEKIVKGLTVDEQAFINQENLVYKGKDYAEDIESAYFYCPKCKAFQTLNSQHNDVHCHNCHATFTVTSDGKILHNNQVYYGFTDQWYDDQMDALDAKIKELKDNSVLFEDHNEAVLDVVKAKTKSPLGQASIRLKKTVFEIHLETDEVITLSVESIKASVQQKNKLIIYDKASKQTFYFINHPKRSALKYVLAIELLQKGVA